MMLDIQCIYEQASELDHRLEYLKRKTIDQFMRHTCLKESNDLNETKFTKAHQMLQIHATLQHQEELTLDLLLPENKMKYGQFSECTLLA